MDLEELQKIADTCNFKHHHYYVLRRLWEYGKKTDNDCRTVNLFFLWFNGKMYRIRKSRKQKRWIVSIMTPKMTERAMRTGLIF